MKRNKGGLDFTRSYHKKKVNLSLMQEAVLWVVEIGIVLLLSYVLVYFLGLRTSVSGRSMEPVLSAGDEILIDRFHYKVFQVRQDDVVVFLPNGNEMSNYYVRRVIGLPGDQIQIRDGKLYVNGEAYAGDAEFPEIEDSGLAGEELKVPSDEYFVLGDNVNSSEDSRHANIGTVRQEDLVGKAWCVVNPKERRGLL